jgi:hypothetical protein
MEKKSVFEAVSEIQEAIKPLGLEIVGFKDGIGILSGGDEGKYIELQVKQKSV